jgi:hypothetical protein
MAQPLLSPSEVFARTWHEGKTYLKSDLKVSSGFLWLSIFSFGLAVISFYVPEGVRLALRVIDIAFFQIIANTWIGLRLSSTVLAERQGKKPRAVTTAMLGSALLISLLSGLAVAGGTLAFVLPGIWMTIAFAFALYVYLDEGRTGREALARSAELVKGRWWGILGRVVLPGLVLLVVSMIASSIIEVIVGLIAGYHPSDLVSPMGFMNWTVLGPPATQVASGALGVINTLPLIIIAPFLTHLMVTLYLELKRTR